MTFVWRRCSACLKRHFGLAIEWRWPICCGQVMEIYTPREGKRG